MRVLLIRVSSLVGLGFGVVGDLVYLFIYVCVCVFLSFRLYFHICICMYFFLRKQVSFILRVGFDLI